MSQRHTSRANWKSEILKPYQTSTKCHSITQKVVSLLHKLIFNVHRLIYLWLYRLYSNLLFACYERNAQQIAITYNCVCMGVRVWVRVVVSAFQPILVTKKKREIITRQKNRTEKRIWTWTNKQSNLGRFCAFFFLPIIKNRL